MNRPGSPLDREEQTTRPESTPDLPEQAGEQPGGLEKSEPGQSPGDPGDRPDHPFDANDPDPRNRDGDAPPGSRTAKTGRWADVGDGWGNLPQHVRDNFRAEDLDDLPPRYRAWIDAYYHRLNERSRRR